MNKPLRYIPVKLTASAILTVLEQIGIHIPTAIRASANQTKDDLAYSIRASKFSLDTAELDAALAKQELSVSDRLKIKWACESIGIY